MSRAIPTLVTALSLLLASPAAAQSPPPAIPSGMDLLYGNRVIIGPGGEPSVSVGIGDKLDVVSLASRQPLQLHYWEHGVLKESHPRPGQTIEVTIVRSQPATQHQFVDLETVPRGARKLLKRTLRGWKKRGYPDVQTLEDGTILGIGGRVVDNRSYRVVIPTNNRTQAELLVDELFERFGHRAVINRRLAERPWAELKLTVGGTPLALATSYVRIKPVQPDGEITVRGVEYGRGYRWHGREDRSYHGELYVVVDASGLLAVTNVVGIESVLAGVVPSEIFASAHPESLKSQAVAARNILLAQLAKRHHTEPFHLCSSQHCQVYGGIGHEDPRTTQAVLATAGQVLFHNHNLVNAVYSSTCGGHTENNDDIWGKTPDPALRGRPDFEVARQTELSQFATGITDEKITAWTASAPAAWCARATQAKPDKFRWSRDFTADKLNRLVASKHPTVGRLKNFHVISRGVGGRALSLRLTGATGEAIVHYELPIRRLLGNLRSAAFTATLTRNPEGYIQDLRLIGGGWGHGVGMCQLGAIGRAEADQRHDQILRYYYNGASIESLYQHHGANMTSGL